MVLVRKVQQGDVEAMVKCEIRLDQDFEVETLTPWGWSEQRFLNAMSQRRDNREGTYDTRTLVAEFQGESESHVMGAMCLELQEEGYEILKMSAHPHAPPEVRKELLKHVVERARRSQFRKKITIHVQDGDWENVKFFQSQGWKPKLVRDYFDNGDDAWRCEREVMGGGGGGKELVAP